MRLRSGRGVVRHNLHSIMDLEDFIHNRTSGKPASIFKKLGDAAKLYVSIDNDDTIRTSKIPLLLGQDHFEKIQDLTIDKVKTLCSSSIFAKSKRFEVINSQHISMNVFPALNRIEGEFRAARIHDQIISWCQDTAGFPYDQSNNCQHISMSCSCRYYEKVTQKMD